MDDISNKTIIPKSDREMVDELAVSPDQEIVHPGDRKARLSYLDSRIEEGQRMALESFERIAPAVYEVWQRALWADDYPNIETWADERHGISRRTVYYYISNRKRSAKLADAGLPEPSHIAQTNALSVLDDEDGEAMARLWQRALEEAKKKLGSDASIDEVVDSITAPMLTELIEEEREQRGDKKQSPVAPLSLSDSDRRKITARILRDYDRLDEDGRRYVRERLS